MDYFENTTRITEEGYAAILRFKNRQQWIVCRSVSLVLAAPLTGRLAYAISLLAVHSVSQYHFGFLDIFFCILFLGGIGSGIIPRHRYRPMCAGRETAWIYRP